MKDYDEKKMESLYLNYQDVNNLYEWSLSEKLPVDGFKCVKNTSGLKKYFMENYNQCNDGEYFFEGYFQYPQKLRDLHIDLPFLSEKMRIEKVEKLAGNLHDQKNMSHI